DTNDGGGIIEAEIHLAKRPKLFRQTEPALTILFQETDIQSIHFPRNHFSAEKPKILRENVIKKSYCSTVNISLVQHASQ
ncbi:hypothetical protein, partial [Rhizobium leguminosarum]